MYLYIVVTDVFYVSWNIYVDVLPNIFRLCGYLVKLNVLVNHSHMRLSFYLLLFNGLFNFKYS